VKTLNKIQAVFLDRDGVLTRSPYPTWKKSQLKLQSGVVDLIRVLNHKKVFVIVVTNQSVVARGLISEDGVRNLHAILQERLKRKGVFVNSFYFCPHHPNATLRQYRKKCTCRKPNIGMFTKAKKEFKINLRKSFTIGDMTQDIFAGKRAGTTTILLKKGHKGMDGKYKVTPDYEAENFNKIIKILKYEF
jgi:histidinol-phosphate phosphatase family protein